MKFSIVWLVLFFWLNPKLKKKMYTQKHQPIDQSNRSHSSEKFSQIGFSSILTELKSNSSILVFHSV